MAELLSTLYVSYLSHLSHLMLLPSRNHHLWPSDALLLAGRQSRDG